MPRYAPKITEQEFRDIVSSYAQSHDFDEEYDIEDYNDVNNIIVTGLMDAHFKSVQGDLKIQFDFENTEVEQIVTLESGVTVAIVSAGGDWEVPLCFAFYYDGKKFRAYIPKDGNPYNRSTKTAYGNADDEDDDNADALKNFGVKNCYGIDPDMTKILSDINSRIQAKGTFVAPVYEKSKKSIRKQLLRDLEPDIGNMDSIGPELLVVRVMPAAGGSYFEVLLKQTSDSYREMTSSELDKVTGIPQSFVRDKNLDTWYGPLGMSSRHTSELLRKEGFEISPDSQIDDYRIGLYII